MKKTIKVQDVKDYANKMLLDTPDSDTQFRQGIIILTEQILRLSDNYTGFTYLDETDMKNSTYGSSVGIHHNQDKFKNTDPTRVRYY